MTKSRKSSNARLPEGVCNCLAVRQAARNLTSIYDHALDPINLRVTQFSILYKLESRGKIRISELADILVMDRTTLTRNVRPLERAGLLAYRQGDDRREHWLTLTPAGRAKFKTALTYWARAQNEFEHAFGRRNAVRLRRTLRSVATTLRA
jgi:DNA-binding MarR family transcriptional regulator